MLRGSTRRWQWRLRTYRAVGYRVRGAFESVRSHLEADTSLSDEQTIEAKQKIDEIEAVVKSNDSKKNKWKKLKPVLLWLADKSVDVGTALLPLLLKIQ